MLSIIIPAYNEERIIKSSLLEVARYFRGVENEFEIVAVNDGSSDRTLPEIEGIKSEMPELKIMTCGVNRGKGYAVRKGVLVSVGDIVLFMDADLSVQPDEWPAFKDAIAGGADIAVGSRGHHDSKIVLRQPMWREFMGKVFTWLANRILFGGKAAVSDVTCGFKVFHGAVAREIFARQRINGWSFDAEVLYIAKKLGYAVRELPVAWRDDPDTKVNAVSAALSSFWGLVKIRWIHRGK